MALVYTALTLGLALALVMGLAMRIASHEFRCGHCGNRFRIKWTRVLYTEHSGKEYRLVCPCCKIRDWCTEEEK